MKWSLRFTSMPCFIGISRDTSSTSRLPRIHPTTLNLPPVTVTSIGLLMTNRFRLSLCLAVLGASCLHAQSPTKIDFSRDIRPILAKNCFACHGPDKQESSLQLSKKETLTEPCDSGEPAIVAGDKDSNLLKRVRSQDASDRMPPEGKPLSQREIALLERWIESGAEYTEHWSFQPIQRPALPTVVQEEWCRTPIDRFLLSQLEQANLKPASPADPRHLIRRLYFNLLGVPPSSEVVDAFVRDFHESENLATSTSDGLIACSPIRDLANSGLGIGSMSCGMQKPIALNGMEPSPMPGVIVTMSFGPLIKTSRTTFS